ncbi:3-hydroxybutyrate dehydrogenase [Simiduia curdlanivorans]|uniref:3-hydroxybutyrate dehydrogenase n=1 Tax=Simiduia curdlanivorans TaxID=1492769 RepID=A0ABV8V482_9GAMM|nr:3-hydroxybutyrate dehydrogenase [Simiduia curdlanivorans]MDN3640114.1 3-hydroxybutyrate dehydrogenase [Simiduia curdlanivorans]
MQSAQISSLPLSGKSALVTGSTSGIGLACAQTLAAKGASLVIHGLVSDEEGNQLAANLAAKFNVDCYFVAGNLADEEAVIALVTRAQALLGRLDILVNNAGIQFTARVENFPIDRWRQVIEVNLTACFTAIKAALPFMQSAKFGRIINIASVHGLVASKEKSAYVAAKHGLVGLTKVVALENAEQGITCNAICPGWVDTAIVAKQIEAKAKMQGISDEQARRELVAEKQPMSHMTSVQAIADLVAFLASDSAATMTGSAIPMDGGWTAQ